MAVSNLPVTSREYKLMLNVDRFRKRIKGADAFFGLFKFLLDKEGGRIIKEQHSEETRITSYLDTPELALRQSGFSLRLRDGSASGEEFDLALKLRSADRYISAAQDVYSSEEGETKFEEDIMPPFISKFSHSTKVKKNKRPRINTVGEAAALFPCLGSLGLDKNTPVTTIKNFEAFEVVHKLCKFDFGKKVEIKSSLSFWYFPGEEDAWPLVAEFSFDYDAPEIKDGLEVYPAVAVEGANRFYSALQNQGGWIDLSGTTKTAFALEVL